MQTIEQRLATAIRLHQTGRIADAEALYRGILQERPEHPDALHLLGMLAHQAGRHEEAGELIRQALAIRGPFALYHANLGGVYLALGRIDEAVKECRQAVRLEPKSADFQNKLGMALRRQGKLDEAADCFVEALRLDEFLIDAACNLAGVWQRQRRLREAIGVLERAIQIAPTHARAHNNLGAALIAAGWPDKALTHLQEAIRLRPRFAEAMSYIAAALCDMNQNEVAIPWFKEALKIEPGNLGMRTSLGHALENIGRIDESIEVYEGTLQCDPDEPTSLFSLTRLACLGHYTLSDERLRHVEKLVERQDVPVEEQYLLHLALAWAYDHARDPARAFAHCRHSKDIRRDFERGRGNVFDPQAHARMIDRMMATFTPEWFVRVRSFGINSELPVFIVGMMRSGTSLAEQILASHPSVHGAGELPDIERLLERHRVRLGIEKTTWKLSPPWMRRQSPLWPRSTWIDFGRWAALRCAWWTRRLSISSTCGSSRPCFHRHGSSTAGVIRWAPACRPISRTSSCHIPIRWTCGTSGCITENTSGSWNTGNACCRCRSSSCNTKS
jgi:tetratricopeptide (TPR) repeat protein